jgi:hypothetical protein
LVQIERRSFDVVTSSVRMTDQFVLPNENKVIHVDHNKGNDVQALYTGASNHMMGCLEEFTSLNMFVCGIVCCSDGSLVEIEGIVFVML